MPTNNNDSDSKLALQEKKINDLVIEATVIGTDYSEKTGMIRVSTNPDNKSDDGFLVYWLRTRAGNDWEWWAPEVGEQVLILSPGGKLGKSYVIGSVPYPLKKESITPKEKGKRWVLEEGENPPSTSDKRRSQSTAHVIQYQDKTTTSYDKKLHIFQASILEDKTIDLKVDAKKDEEKAYFKIKEDIVIKADATKDKNKVSVKVSKINVNIDATNGAEKITIDVNGKTKLEMDAKEELITIDSSGKIMIKAKDITLELMNSGKVGLACKELSIDSQGDVKVQSTGKVAVKGSPIELNC